MSDLRTAKKIATRRALSEAARRLTMEHGYDEVTVEEIAEEAGVSPRTFFNYFSCKGEAVVGTEPTFVDDFADRVRNRPAHEDPLTALRAVLGEVSESDLTHRWMTFTELAHRHPELLPRHLAVVVDFERALTGAIAERLGTDPSVDPYPKLVVAWAMTTLRSTIEWWHQTGHATPLRSAIDRGFDLLVAGPAPTGAR